MKTWLTLKPGEQGAKQLAEEYGDSLVCAHFPSLLHPAKDW
ncbi:MAG: hypothetical protein PHP95_06550 [Desulfuromonadaceae bacterium]|nr:hypothetical protein [Desulfuromonadaceae bacterium]MDD2848101.1 hypothetical protein [Desulfuromonadaceae bacterium]MDD4132058.1 hypothetical protein [Desulfuromonadaceae bacterium]